MAKEKEYQEKVRNNKIEDRNNYIQRLEEQRNKQVEVNNLLMLNNFKTRECLEEAAREKRIKDAERKRQYAEELKKQMVIY